MLLQQASQSSGNSRYQANIEVLSLFQHLLIICNAVSQIVIEGLKGLGYEGDMAIDDISFTPSCIVIPGATVPPVAPTTHAPVTKPGGCHGDDFYCADNSTCLPADRKCDFTRDCEDESDELDCPTNCDFEVWKKIVYA